MEVKGQIILTCNYLCFRGEKDLEEHMVKVKYANIKKIVKIRAIRKSKKGIVVHTNDEKYTFNGFENRAK